MSRKSTSKFNDWNHYYQHVIADYRLMKEEYPFCFLTIPPTVEPQLATIHVIAANKSLILQIGGSEVDFLGEYTKELHIIIPVEYREVGCNVYGAGWVDIGRFDENDIHFFADDGKLIPSKHGFHLCVGTPESFPMMQNVILENVRTADNMLVAYERVMVGASNKVELIAYAHGNEGRKQFSHNKSRFISKR